MTIYHEQCYASRTRRRFHLATNEFLRMEEIHKDAIPETEIADSRRAKSASKWLQLAAVLAAVVNQPYVYSITKQAENQQKFASELLTNLAANAGVMLLMSLGFIALGLRLRSSLGLSLNVLVDGGVADGQTSHRVRNAIMLAILLGLGLGVLIAIGDYFVSPYLPEPPKPLSSPPAWIGLFASVGAGIQEEIWFRWGIMTTLIWLGTRIIRQPSPTGCMVWTANILAATLFGAAHIPQGMAFYGLNTPLVASALIGNGMPGVVFGWLYWRHGLAAAMVCHFAADVLLKVVLPLLGVD